MTAVPINYLAVIAATVIAFVLGYVWYGFLFQKPWMEAMGMTPEKMAQMQATEKNKMMIGYALQFLGTLIMSFVLAHALVFASAYLSITGITAGLMGGFWNWIGFIAPVTLGTVLWDGKPWKVWYINAGYYLVALLLMGIILSLWR